MACTASSVTSAFLRCTFTEPPTGSATSYSGTGTLPRAAAVWVSEVGRRDEAPTASQDAVEINRRLAAADPVGSDRDLAGSLNNLSNDLATVGRRDEALAVIQDAVEIRRRLFAANPAGYGSDLAQSLNNLSNRLAEAGRKKESDALGDIGRYLLEGSNVIGPRPLPAKKHCVGRCSDRSRHLPWGMSMTSTCSVLGKDGPGTAADGGDRD